MSEPRPASPVLSAHEAAALRQTGASPLRPGDPGRVGPYMPLALLGSGGMGRVYLARPTEDGPGLVAVKVVRPEYAEDARFRRRFEREAAVHEKVRNPHTPRLRGAGFQDELLWMATEYLPGLDLAEAVRGGGALEPAAVWRLVGELGRALADLSAAGIVHRDVKPSNVLLSVRGAHVIDFGISRAADASAITGTGNRVGTPAYMSPEHLRTGRSDTASDVFSLAGTLVYAASGHAPFGDGTGVDVMHRVAFEEPNPEIVGGISAADPALSALLTACLAKEPERRPSPRDLIGAARPYSGTTDWPQPLGGQVLARQRAYEVLRDGLGEATPVSGAASSAPPTSEPAAAEPAAAEPAASGPQASVPQASGPQAFEPPASRPLADAVALAAAALPRRLRLAGLPARVRKKTVLALTGAVVLCALLTTELVLSRQDPPATGSSPSAAATAPGGIMAGAVDPSQTPGKSLPAAPGEDADGAADATVGSGTTASAPEASGSAGTGRRDDASAPDSTRPSASADTGTPPTDASPGSASPPWISDCTYYPGYGQTSEGDSGKKVLQVQCMLTKRGYSVGGRGVDGKFGPTTTAAVRSFESDKGLDPDGVVDHTTWTALRSTQ